MISIVRVVVLCASPAALLAQGQPSGALQGAVTDTQGKPVVGAIVRYQSIPPSVAAGIKAIPVPGETIASGTITTDANGRFTAAGLPFATHLLCAHVPSAPYLDPCVWGQTVRATVSAGVIANQTLILTKGVYVNVRVNDPMHLLPQTLDGPWTPRKLQIGVVYGTGAYHGAQNTAADSTGRSYQMIIPAGKPFRLWLYSTDVRLSDGSGTAITSPAAAIPFQAAPGQDQTFTLTVVGPRTQ
jgi:hypothetical protein